MDIINDHVYYLSGTPATQSQLAKDVVTFLAWAGEPYYDSKKALEFKVKRSMINLKFLILFRFLFYWSANALNFQFFFHIDQLTCIFIFRLIYYSECCFLDPTTSTEELGVL